MPAGVMFVIVSPWSMLSYSPVCPISIQFGSLALSA